MHVFTQLHYRPIYGIVYCYANYLLDIQLYFLHIVINKLYGIINIMIKQLSKTAYLVLAILIAGFFSASPLYVYALTPDPASAKITFTFDDARASTYTKAAGILKTAGLKGTLYVTTGCVGMTKTPNTCHAAHDVSYMTWAQVTAMQNTYGWEIGSHSVTHPYMASSNADDGQPNIISAAQLEYEISGSKAALAEHGINAQSFASPYGDYNMESLRIIANYYTSHRAFKEQNNNVYPYNDRLLNNLQIQYSVTLAAVQAKVDEAISKKTWLVLTFHDIVDRASMNPNKYQWSTSNLTSLASYVKSKITAGSLKNVNVTEGLVTGTNLLPPVITNKQLANGWSTDTPAAFVPSSTFASMQTAETITSLRALGSASSAHLFSPRVNVNSGYVYVIKNYLSVTAITKGEIGYYIDEYDASGQWISGQYKTREPTVYVENLNFVYQPSSVAVRAARLQVYTTPGSGLQATVDNFGWYVVAGAAVANTNLFANGGFDTGLGTWTTDNSTAVIADTLGHGSGATPATSVAFSRTSGTAHLFSPLTPVVTGKSYHFEHYLNITANNGGEVGTYIDEYDASGKWISGQYKTTSSTLGQRTIQFNYTPTGATVARIREQVIIYAPTGAISGYIDDVSLVQL